MYGFNRLTHEWKFKAVYADPIAFEEEFPYRRRATALGLPDTAALELAQLVNGSPLTQKRVLELNVRRDTIPLEFLDTAAELLATQFAAATDADSLDVNGWICRLLTQRGGPRYESLLQRVAADATDRNLRRLASLEIVKNSGAPPEPYRVGTIALERQRAAYPAPYPDSTYRGTSPK